MVTPKINYELKHHKCPLQFILYVSEIENLLNATNNLYLRYLFFRPMYSALATNPPLPTTLLLGSKQDNLIETCRKFYVEEPLSLYSTSYNIWVIKDYESGAACGTHGAEEKYIQGFSEETCMEEDTWKTKT
jgi:hypothetical protein